MNTKRIKVLKDKEFIKVKGSVKGLEIWHTGQIGVTDPEWRKNDLRGECVWANQDACVLTSDGTRSERIAAARAYEDACVTLELGDLVEIVGEGLFEVYRINRTNSDFVWFRKDTKRRCTRCRGALTELSFRDETGEQNSAIGYEYHVDEEQADFNQPKARFGTWLVELFACKACGMVQVLPDHIADAEEAS